jgi:hypothetical protein
VNRSEDVDAIVTVRKVDVEGLKAVDLVECSGDESNFEMY